MVIEASQSTDFLFPNPIPYNTAIKPQPNITKYTASKLDKAANEGGKMVSSSSFLFAVGLAAFHRSTQLLVEIHDVMIRLKWERSEA